MKKIYIKPAFYANYLLRLQNTARFCGYNLLLHGSMNRDLDLVAVPWLDNPKPEIELIRALDFVLNEKMESNDENYMKSRLPGGRNNYIINLLRASEKNDYNDPEFYLDISITPLSSCE